MAVAWKAALLLCCVLLALGCARAEPGDAEERRRQLGRDVLTVVSKGELDGADREPGISMNVVRIANVKSPQGWSLACKSGNLSSSLTENSFTVPNIQGAKDDNCQLTTFPSCPRFADDLVNLFVVDLFKKVAASDAPEFGLPNVVFSRYDLYMGDIFFNQEDEDCGIVLRAKSYPKQDDEFSLNLGFCQEGSDVTFTQESMDLRNFLWYQGQLVALNVTNEGPLNDLVGDDASLQLVKTVFETRFGDSVAAVNYFDSLRNRPEENRLFVCRTS